MSIFITCPFCSALDVPKYTNETAEHKVVAFWKCSGGICRFLECKPETGKRVAKWWNAQQGCVCSEPWKVCTEFQAKHPHPAIDEG